MGIAGATAVEHTSKPAEASRLAAVDIHSNRNEYVFALPGTLSHAAVLLLNDKRDEPALHLLCNIVCTTVPAAVLLHSAGIQSHLLGLAYFVINYVLYLQRFLLTLHYTEHRKLFKPGVKYGMGAAVTLLTC